MALRSKLRDLAYSAGETALPKAIRYKGVLLSMRRAASHWTKDAYILSYPKSGRTWLRTMLGTMASSQFELDVQNPMEVQNFWKLSREIPNIGITHDGSPNFQYGYEVETDKSRYRSKKVLLLTRDPRDVLVSYYFDAKNRMKVIDCDISTYIREEKGSIDAIVAYYNAWAQARTIPRDFLSVSYGDMHRDPKKVVRDCAAFLGLPAPSEELLDLVVEKASFSSMRNAELNDRFNHQRLRPADPQNPESFKVRRGKMGGYVDYLSRDDIAYVDDYIDRNLDPFFSRYYSEAKATQLPSAAPIANRPPLRVSPASAGGKIATPKQQANNDNRYREPFKRVAATVAVFACGWFAHDLDSRFVPQASAASLVNEAQEAYLASAIRADMTSQVESKNVDRSEILVATGIELPSIPEGWLVTDAQLYPSDLGHSVVVTMTTPENERVSLFAAEEDTSISDSPSMESDNGLPVACWEDDKVVLALVGDLDAARLMDLANTLDKDS